jgi:hypothetical protein
MVAAALVGLEIEAGLQAVSSLEDAGIALKVALWMITSEYEEGRLVLASPSLDQKNPLKAYKAVLEILREGPSHSRPMLLVLRMKDPFIQSVRQKYAKAKDVEGTRLGGQIGNRYVLDGYVYQIR